ncbi:hypothetical protein JW935_19650 [candidate division KSB1 bacterium]|nr:hypothetical protein [candidate division KSB1 bacterium]
MKCPNKTTLFNYLQKELDQKTKKDISLHVKECAGCQKTIDTLVNNSLLVKNSLKRLEPVDIPPTPFFFKPSPRKNQTTLRPIIARIHLKPAAAWLCATAVCVAVLLGITVFRNTKSVKPNLEEVSRHIAAMEQSYLADPKQAFHQNVLCLSVYDDNKKQVKITVTNSNEKTITENVIQLN